MHSPLRILTFGLLSVSLASAQDKEKKEAAPPPPPVVTRATVTIAGKEIRQDAEGPARIHREPGKVTTP